jgi:hypothetical protein
MDEELPGLTAKISNALSRGSEYIVIQAAELRALQEMSPAELGEFARNRGWRVIRRLGGRQIEFYNDASVQPL